MKLVKRRRIGAAVAAWSIAALALFVVLLFSLASPRDWIVDDTRYAAEIARAARRSGIDPELVRALIFQESRFDPQARGRHGELGLMQLLPEGAVAEWSRLTRQPLPTEAELLTVDRNLEIGCWYLARGLERYREYRDCVAMALAWYNAGDARVRRWKPDRPDGDFVSRIDIAGTALYVKKITSRYHHYLAAAKKKP